MNEPIINTCLAVTCAYNSDKKCHAQAITVGDAEHPACDTFKLSNFKGNANVKGKVVACRVSNCSFNQSLSCNAKTINVGFHGEHPDCTTRMDR